MKFAFAGTSGGIQTASSGNTSLILAEGGSSLLVDASGSPAGALAACGLDPEHLGGVILTHGHIDHIYALPSLLHNLWLMGRKAPLPVIGSEPTLEIAQRLCGLFALERKPGIFAFDWRITVPGAVLESGPFTISTFATRHGLPTMGLAVSSAGCKLVYSADTSPLDSWPSGAAGACVLVHEAAGLEDREESHNASGHSSARQAALAASALAGMAPEAPLPCLMLCHLPAGEELIGKMRLEAQHFYPGPVCIPAPLRLYDAADAVHAACRKPKE
jgi:ribonuclease Z